MRIQRRIKTSKAFALPTVLIASVVLLSVLAVSVTATTAVRTALRAQYYTQLAQIAGEAGVAYAKACLVASGNVPQWTDAKPLTPASDCSGNVLLSSNVRALVVAGGGSGGGSTGGGGGGGGVLYDTTVGVSAASYSIVVGAGGAIPGNQSRGISGQNSSFKSLVAIGGGGGGYSASSGAVANGYNGGSGGGGQNYNGSNASGTGTPGQGYGGGPLGITSGSGGGGAGGPGLAGPSSNVGGDGGPGIQNNIVGSTLYYSAGGGGANGGKAGAGGDQTPGPVYGLAPSGASNTGNGGTGGWAYSTGNGGAGGSGVVIISYPTSSGIVATGGSITTAGGYTIHKFTSSSTFTVSSTGTFVTVDGNVRSSFSVPKPNVDSQGRALTIPNSGYVEILRSSTGEVWRTYKQPSVQAAVVPDLCSGNATAARGWAAAVKTTQQNKLDSAASAQTISLADSALNAGRIYLRKDFNVSTSTTYDLDVHTASDKDIAETYLDGVPISTAKGSLSTVKTDIAAGCHTLVIQLTNDTYAPRGSGVTASITRSGAASPVAVTDTAWRVTAGDAIHFSMDNYHETPTAWEQVYDFGAWNDPALLWSALGWNTKSGDELARFISTQFSTGGSNRPLSSYSWYRSSTPFVLTDVKTVRVSQFCDDNCTLLLDGENVGFTMGSSGIMTKTITIQPGSHTFGVQLYNGSGADSAFLFAAVDTETGQVLERSSPGWNATTSWSATGGDLFSYDAAYIPTPVVQATSNARVLVVGGGGGGGSGMGGGGGGGGVKYNAAYPLSAGSYAVTVGAGGGGGPAGNDQVAAGNGGNSRFGIMNAIGGGGGGSGYISAAGAPGAGASAGGSAGCNQSVNAAPVIGQGYASVPTAGCYYPTGGGGAGGLGATNPATGGVGVVNSIMGTSYYFGGGGGGSGYTGIGGNGGNGGGGGGAIGTTTGGSGLNAGSPGSGGAIVSQANTPGGNAGANTGGGGGGGSHYNSNNYGGTGGSGIVVISYPTGTMTAAGGTVATSGGRTIHRFTTSGTFTVSSFN